MLLTPKLTWNRALPEIHIKRDTTRTETQGRYLAFSTRTRWSMACAPLRLICSASLALLHPAFINVIVELECRGLIIRVPR
jgi:hypothetical protein